MIHADKLIDYGIAWPLKNTCALFSRYIFVSGLSVIFIVSVTQHLGKREMRFMSSSVVPLMTVFYPFHHQSERETRLFRALNYNVHIILTIVHRDIFKQKTHVEDNGNYCSKCLKYIWKAVKSPENVIVITCRYPLRKDDQLEFISALITNIGAWEVIIIDEIVSRF